MIPANHCSCPCHHTPGMKHFVACCDALPMREEGRYCPECDGVVPIMLLMFGEETCADCGYLYGYVDDYEED